jgi:glutathionylspermidine synthase
MRRYTVSPRKDWQKKVESVGLTYHTLDSGVLPNGVDGPQPYWDESVYYELTAREVDVLEAATERLQEMCLAAGQSIVDNRRFADLKIPASAVPAIVDTWNREPPALYGRFDLAFDGSQIKLLEYNADTPTALVEAAVAQWYWLQDCFPKADQFNSIHEKLIAKWKDLKPYVTEPVYFAHLDVDEDAMTVTYLRDTADQADIRTRDILVSDIGWDARKSRFLDLENRTIASIFKLYPWELMLAEEFGPHALETMSTMQWIEPIWKMLFSNKGLLAILWEMYPHDELLLPAYLDGPRDLQDYVRKPLLGREGANLTLMANGEKQQTYGPYGAEGFVYQALAPIPNLQGNYPVIGSWIVADQGSAGIGIRESNTPVTTNTSRFVPHLFR